MKHFHHVAKHLTFLNSRVYSIIVKLLMAIFTEIAYKALATCCQEHLLLAKIDNIFKKFVSQHVASNFIFCLMFSRLMIYIILPNYSYIIIEIAFKAWQNIASNIIFHTQISQPLNTFFIISSASLISDIFQSQLRFFKSYVIYQNLINTKF